MKKDFFTETIGKSFADFQKEAQPNASSGNYSKSASSGNFSTSASSGDYSTSASSGNSSKSASSGISSKSASSGNFSTSASSGNYSKSASSGNFSKSASSGNFSTSASSGDYSTPASSGNYSTSASSGDYSTSASSGNYSKSSCDGEYSSATVNGFFGAVMGTTDGSVIVAVEFDKERKPIGFAGGIIGKDGIEPNKYYVAHEGKLKELNTTDGIRSIILQEKGNVKKVLDTDFNEMYLVTDGVNSAHGTTIKNAREALNYKISKRDLSEFKNLTKESKLTYKEMLTAYRSITGACETGIRNWIKTNGIKAKPYTIAEVIKLTKGAYGNNVFAEFFE